MKQDSYISEPQGRRDFFKKLVLASVAMNLPMAMLSCKKEANDFVGTGKLPYKIWEEILHYLQTSPDNLKARMEHLIKERNPEAMYDFVKNEIQLVPVSKNAIGRLGTHFKWGINYALRSGMATPREKAELLHMMYQKAEIPSKVVFESFIISPEEAQTYFFRSTNNVFAPDISEKKLKQWAKELGVSIKQEPTNISLEDELKLANDLGEKIIKSLKLPENQYYKPFDFRWNGYETPIVEFEIDNQVKYANLFDPKTSFGNLKSDSDKNIRPAKPVKENDDKVSVKIAYRDSITPRNEQELIRGEWLAKDLVGRQLGICFLDNLSLEMQSVTPMGNVNVFTPALALQAIDESQEYMAERSVMADPITLAGKRITLSQNDATNIGEVSLLQKPNKTLQKTVESLQANAKTTGYPGVKLSVTPRNKDNQLVEGLSAQDFKITENGKPINAILESNQRTPRILIMADRSSSMPSEFFGKQMDVFIETLKKNILKTYPAAIVNFWGTPSSLFTWLLKASQTDNDLIIFATDGHNDDVFNPNDVQTYRNGPPAIVLDVTNSSQGYFDRTFEKMAEITNGSHLKVNNHDAAIKGINAYLKNIEIQPYTFAYHSVGDKDLRKVTITIDNERLSANTSYTFDSINDVSQIGPKIIGLYLYVKYANEREVKRVIAGWDHAIKPNEKPSQTMANDVHDLMLGGMQLYFEGTGPSYSAALSDLLKVKLSTRKWGEALIDNNLEKAKTYFKEGHLNLSGKALSLMAPLSNPVTPETMTIPGGLRIGLHTEKPGAITGEYTSLFDYLPTSKYVTLSADAKKGFRTTIIKTAELAAREHRMFAQSTFSELQDKTWINFKESRETNWAADYPEEKGSFYWRERVFRGASLRIFDASASSKAFWNIDSNGELYGILPNASGGGGERFKAQLQEISDVINMYMSLFGIMGVGGLSVGIMAQYGLTLVKLYAIASEALVVMDTSGMDDKIAKALKELACNVQKEIMLATMGNAGAIMGGLDNLISQMGGKSPIGC